MNNICSQDGAVRDQLKLCVDELLQVSVLAYCMQNRI